MEIRKKTINKGQVNECTWTFVNEYWETRNAWGHRTNILRNNYDYGINHKVRYYNRTWEMYTYQTCMRGALAELKEQELEYYIKQYKDLHNIERFKKGQKEQVIEKFNNTEIGKELEILKQAIEERSFD